MKEETKKAIAQRLCAVNTGLSDTTLYSIRKASEGASKLLLDTDAEYKGKDRLLEAATDASMAIVTAPISAAAGVLMAGYSVVLGTAVLTVSLGMATKREIKKLVSTNTQPVVAAQK